MGERKEENLKPLNEFIYTWRIENVSLCWQRTDEKLESPSFEVDWLPEFPFNLCLYPKGTKGNGDLVSYYLAQEKKASMSNKRFKVDLYLLAVDGSKVQPESSEGFMSMRKNGMFGCSRFMSWETLINKGSDYLPDDILTVCCRIWSEIKPDTKGNKLTEIKACSNQSFARTQIKKEVIAKQMVIDNIAPEGQIIGEIKSILQDDAFVTFNVSFGKISGYRSLNIDAYFKKDRKIKMAIIKLMLIDEKKRRIFWMKTYRWNDLDEYEIMVLSSHFPQDSVQYVPHELFVERFLFLACQVTYTTGFVVQKREKDDYGTNLKHLLPLYFPSTYVQTVRCPTLADALFNISEDISFRDVKIECGMSVIRAHKIVLCSRSTKFEAILKSQDKLTSLPVIKVEDNFETMIRVVYFLYSDKVPDINWQRATNLYSAAINYEIHLLKLKCCNYISSNLDTSNVVEILLLAKKHNDVELIASARKFIMENRSAVYSSNEWDNFRNSHSNFALEIMLPQFQSN